MFNFYFGGCNNGRPLAQNYSIVDEGGKPFVINIEKATLENTNFRTAIWTGEHLQVTLMCIPPGENIGLEKHDNLDQFLRLEQGKGIVQLGDQKDNLYYERQVGSSDAIVIPAGSWHNLTNIGNVPIKLYSIYAPPQHPMGTVHKDKSDEDH